jgi:hypothetical protein
VPRPPNGYGFLKSDLEDEPFDIAAPDDVDIYDGDATTVATNDIDDQ